MVMYKWFKKAVPKDITICQVYGIVFSDNGQVLLQQSNNQYNLTGGKPEIIDRNFNETLKREYSEELNIKITDLYYLGYFLVEEHSEKYA